MNALMSSRPRRGSCREYLSSMFGAAISSTTPRLTRLPQNSANQRPTTALLSSSLLIGMAPRDLSRNDHRHQPMIRTKTYRLNRARRTLVLALKSKAEIAQPADHVSTGMTRGGHFRRPQVALTSIRQVRQRRTAE